MSKLQRLKQVVVGSLPLPLAERMLPWRRAEFRAAGVTKVAQAPRCLLVGPVNSAGQGYAWARAAERLPGVAAANFMYRGAGDAFHFPADHTVSTAYFVSNRRWQRAQRRAIQKNFTHVLMESGRPLLGNGPAGDDLRVLQRNGIAVALLWHGSDIRIPSVHARTEQDSPFRHGSYPEQERLEEIARANHALMASPGIQSFVSTPDLLDSAPGATWLPVVVDPQRWAAAATALPLTRKRPVVVHAPSRAGLKGTSLIADAVRALDAEGIIEYRQLVGIPAAEMPAVYGDADIVLDQFSLGIYGVAACEALASGRVVVSHVSDAVRRRVRAFTSRDLPIIESSAADLESTIRRLVTDPTHAQSVAVTGPAFIREVHDGARSSAVLGAYLGIATPDADPGMGD
ncbi:glycosyltransferase [Microbacterium sp. A84]|uniref:glycosyltransferase n=1 Tax=Microbacterium sp. A84 TaxID=3450715 RepID=UPI003F41C9BD